MFRPDTVGERAVRIDRYGVTEPLIVDDRSTTIYVSSLGGGAPVVNGVDGANLYMKTLVEGTNITFDETPSTITINAGGGGGSGITTITSGAGDESLVQVGTAPVATLKALTAGSGVGLTADANQITIDNTATIADSSVSGDESLVNTGTAPNYLLKRLAAGTGIVLSSDADVITIDNSGAGTTPTLTGLAGTESLVPGSPQVSFMLSVKSLNAGAGISLSSDANAVTITNSGVAQVYTLSDAAGATGQTLIAASAPTANDFRLYRILAGAGIIVSQSGGDVTITYSGAATAVTLASAGGSSLVTDGTGPDLAIKGVATSDFVRLVTTGTTFSVDNRCMRVKGTDANTPSQTVSDNASATGTPSAAYGTAATASGNNSAAFGDDALANNTGTSAFGSGASATGLNSSAYGRLATASGASSQAAGRGAVASGARSNASGYSSTASGDDSQSRAYLSIASGDNSIADGPGAVATANGSKAIGANVRVTGARSTGIGHSDDNTYSFTAENDTHVFARRAGGATSFGAIVKPSQTLTSAPWQTFWIRDYFTSPIAPPNNFSVVDSNIFFGGMANFHGSGAWECYLPTITASTLDPENVRGSSTVTGNIRAGGQFTIINNSASTLTLGSVTNTVRFSEYTTAIGAYPKYPFSLVIAANSVARFHWFFFNSTDIWVLPGLIGSLGTA